jgi:hypothetical protein
MLGVLDIVYSDAGGSGVAGAKTTGDVASILESKYGVMAAFYDLRQEKIAQWIADDVSSQIEMYVKTGRRPAPEHGSLTYGADQKIEAEFRAFLSANELAHLMAAAGAGVLSAAAAAGVNHRKKQPFAKKNKARPAFVDTGTYRSSFRSWSTR